MVGVNVWWVEGEYICIIERVLGVFPDESLKASHLSTRIELMWAGVNLRVP